MRLWTTAQVLSTKNENRGVPIYLGAPVGGGSSRACWDLQTHVSV
jgi:hypothetical protein